MIQTTTGVPKPSLFSINKFLLAWRTQLSQSGKAQITKTGSINKKVASKSAHFPTISIMAFKSGVKII